MKTVKFLVCLLVVAISGRAHAALENVEQTKNGLLIHYGQAQVELAAVNTNTLRLSLSLTGRPQVSASTFLANLGSNNSVPWQMAKHHGMIGIRTTCGELLINPKNGRWTLENASGKKLITPHVMGDFSQQNENSSLAITLGWKKGKPVCVYGR